ncbi:MAG: transketolase [Coriobacteriia bacterium]
MCADERDPILTEGALRELSARARTARGQVLTATSLAGSGHPGGSFSSMEIYTLLYWFARIRPSEPLWSGRDRILISHGHTSPGVYAALAEAGFFPAEEFAAHFRQAGSPFEGHVERRVPGTEWSTGNLGQGLSAGVGFALGARLTQADWRTFVVMSDAEQNKGQVAEARRLAVKERLGSLTAIIDWNNAQISGHASEVMPVRIAEDWAADGWRVLECDGHDFEALYRALTDALDDGVPSVVLAHTIIGKGVSFMEDDPQYHGRALTADEYRRAMGELGLDPHELDRARERRSEPCSVKGIAHTTHAVPLDLGVPRAYAADAVTDNRSAWGSALIDIAERNPDLPIAVFDCDLMESVKTAAFAEARPGSFVQCGVAEQNAASAAGALSIVPGVLVLWADFGVFGIDEVYNQQRLNDINDANLKLVVTHCGLDVGEDGRTHHCLDYVGALRNQFGWRVFVPADPNQTDRVVRYAAGLPGPVAVAVGRSKLPVLLSTDGTPAFGEDYVFEPGEIDWVREGTSATLLVMGTLAGRAAAAADRLAGEGIGVRVGIVAAPLELKSEAMREAAASPLLVTVEDHNVRSGLGASCAEWLAEHPSATRLVRLGVDRYHSSGASKDLFREAHLDEESIAERVRRELEA